MFFFQKNATQRSEVRFERFEEEIALACEIFEHMLHDPMHLLVETHRVLEDGDVVSIDCGAIVDGWHGDSAITVVLGERPDPQDVALSDATRKAMWAGIAALAKANRLNDVAAAIEDVAIEAKLFPLAGFVGHGIGRKFHEEPKVSHVGVRGRGERLRAGMTFTIEPMINLGSHEVEVLEDEWTAVTVDGSLSAQFEHTLLVTEDGVEILTVRPGPLENSEIFPDYWS